MKIELNKTPEEDKSVEVACAYGCAFYSHHEHV